ncbi:membrane-associated progesterone receptor component 1-like, partial [Sceloporus undulatus]
MAKEEAPTPVAEGPSLLLELVSSPLNLSLLGRCLFLLFQILRGRDQGGGGQCPEDEELPLPPKLKRWDFNLWQLWPFDGWQEPRILMAFNGKVFDVSRGRKFYGPDGPYGIFAGRDASR